MTEAPPSELRAVLALEGFSYSGWLKVKMSILVAWCSSIPDVHVVVLFSIIFLGNILASVILHKNSVTNKREKRNFKSGT